MLIHEEFTDDDANDMMQVELGQICRLRDKAEIVDILLESGAGLGVVESMADTPLHSAVLYYPSTMQTVDLLLEKGADVTALNFLSS